MIQERQALKTMSKFNIHYASIWEGWHFGCLVVQTIIIEHILEAQGKDERLRKWFPKHQQKIVKNGMLAQMED